MPTNLQTASNTSLVSVVEVHNPAPPMNDNMTAEAPAANGPSDNVRIVPIDRSRLNSVTMPYKLVGRGRPKGTEKSLNRKYGSKGLSKTTERESKRKRPTVDDISDSICYICLQEEPEKSQMIGSVIDWVDCGRKCTRWFHVVCLPEDADPAHYTCRFCV